MTSPSEPALHQRLVTPYAFIDTEAFRSTGLDWNSRTWTSLADLAKRSILNPLTTSITTREVGARLAEALGEAEAAAQKHGAIFSQLSSGTVLGEGDRDTRQSELDRRFRKFLKKAKFEEVAVDIKIEDVLDDYFGGKPPFGTGKKKHEFPDAFVLSSLMAWTKRGRRKLYVVGRDPDLVAFCAARDDMIQLDSVAALLSLALASAELQAQLETHVRADKDLLERVRMRLNEYRPRRSGVDVEDVDFSDLEIDSVLLVDEPEEGNVFVLEVGVVASVEVEVSETGHEYVVSRRGEPDIELRTHRERPISTAIVYLEVLVTSEVEEGVTTFETADWDITSGEIEVELPRQFSRRSLSLEPR